jgi:hypothetical protein
MSIVGDAFIDEAFIGVGDSFKVSSYTEDCAGGYGFRR